MPITYNLKATNIYEKDSTKKEKYGQEIAWEISKSFYVLVQQLPYILCLLGQHKKADKGSKFCTMYTFRHTKGPSMSFNPDFIQILSRFYPDNLPILS